MREFGVQLHSLHKFVRNTHGYVGTGHFLKVLFDRYKILDIWMRHIHSKHQGSAASVLRHLTCGVGKTLHERNGAGRSAGRVRYHRIFRTQARNVHAYSATALKQLHELFIGVAYTAIRVLYRRNYHTVGQRSYYLSIAKGRHDAALRHYVAELVEQGKYFFFTHFNARFSVIRQALLILRRIFFLDTREFGSHAPVHIGWRLFEQTTLVVLEGILFNPRGCGQLITLEVFQGIGQNFVIVVGLLFYRGRIRPIDSGFHLQTIFLKPGALHRARR